MALSRRLLEQDLLFRVGLGARLLLVFLVAPDVQERWFVPFVKAFITNPTLDPWTHFLVQGGDTLSFPYGPIMLLAHSPPVALGMLGDYAIDSAYFASLGFRLSLLSADLFAMHLLMRVHSDRTRRALILFWLSPLCLYITYFHGQTDIVPVMLLIAQLYHLQRHRPVAAGVFLGLACAAKFSMVLAAPFSLIYLYRNQRLRHLLPQFLASSGLVVTALYVPYLVSQGYLTMTLGTPEARKVYQLALSVGPYKVYLTPLCYLMLLYYEWRVRRISFGLLMAITGIGFVAVVMLTPPTVGWYLWFIPFLPMQRSDRRVTDFLLNMAFALATTGLHLFVSDGASWTVASGAPLLPWAPADELLSPHLRSLWLTGLIAMALVLTLRLLRDGVAHNDYYRLSRAPLGLGIGGDSSAGKDSLALSLAGLFGQHSTALVSGDDYHSWDRHAPMWRATTHLHPRANNLRGLMDDVRSLLEGRSVMCRRYDHATGYFTERRRLARNDAVIVSGLHTLYPAELRSLLDLRIFLEVDEDLRRSWKVARDTKKRGHPPASVIESIERRAPDAQRFIAPQRKHADVVLRVEPVVPYKFVVEGEHFSAPPKRLRLRVELSRGLSGEGLARVLVGLIGAQVDRETIDEAGRVALLIEGDFDGDDIALAVHHILPQVDELLDLQPRWQGGVAGLMQLVILVQATEALHGRGRG